MLKTYTIAINASGNRTTFSGNNILSGKKVIAFYHDSIQNSSQYGLLSLSEFEVTIYNKSGEIVREAVSKKILALNQIENGKGFDFMQANTSFENIDLERSFVWIGNPVANSVILLRFIVQE